MHSIQYYVIKSVSDFEKGQWFSPVSSTNETDHHDITEILLKVALNTINQNQLTNALFQFDKESFIKFMVLGLKLIHVPA